jgi:hypothetical protein
MTGLLGIFTGITTLINAVKELTGTVNYALVLKIVAQAFSLSKKHGVAILGDLSKGNVEAAITEATQFVLDELKAIEGIQVTNIPSTSTSSAS